MNKLPGLILGFAAGVGAGAVSGLLLGILFAPHEGAETRRRIRQKAIDARQQAMDKMRKNKAGVTEKTTQAVDATREALNKVEQQAREAAASASDETLPR